MVINYRLSPFFTTYFSLNGTEGALLYGEEKACLYCKAACVSANNCKSHVVLRIQCPDTNFSLVHLWKKQMIGDGEKVQNPTKVVIKDCWHFYSSTSTILSKKVAPTVISCGITSNGAMSVCEWNNFFKKRGSFCLAGSKFMLGGGLIEAKTVHSTWDHCVWTHILHALTVQLSHMELPFMNLWWHLLLA